MKLGQRIKTLRRERAWSQAHLAEAAGVSVRTIQRLERRSRCSDETLLAVAAAFDIDVRRLTQHELPQAAASPSSSQRKARRLGYDVSPRQAALWGSLLAFPGLLFVVANVLKYEVGVPHLYDALALLGQGTGLDRVFEQLSPLLLLGGPVLAVLLNLFAQVRVWGDDIDEGFSILGLDLCFDVRSSLVLVSALVGVALLLGYLTVENAAEWVMVIADR